MSKQGGALLACVSVGSGWSPWLLGCQGGALQQ